MPRSSEVHVDAALSNVAVQYRNSSAMYIADRVLIPTPVKKESDKYYIYTQQNWLQIPFTQRGDGAEAGEGTWAVSTETYQCEEYAWKDIVTKRTRKNADSPIDPDIDTTEFVTNVVLLGREKRVADAIFNATTFASYTSALTTANRWDNYTSDDSDPFADIADAKTSVLKNAQALANTIIVGYETFEKLRRHPLVLDVIKYTYGATQDKVSAELLAKAFDVKNFLVGRAVYDSATEGQSVSGAFVWGKYAMVCYIAPKVPKKGVTLGATFRAQDFQVETWYEGKRKGDMIEASIIDDEVIVAAAAGYLYSTVIS